MAAAVVNVYSFPENISSIGAGEEKRFTRYDFSIFKKLMKHLENSGVKSLLGYSDYGVTKFTDSDIDFSLLRYGILPKIKYTTNDEYIVLKGKKDHRTGAMVVSYKDLARRIIQSEYYFGNDFSHGDYEIYLKAQEGQGVGNARNWVTYCANHHIAVLLAQLSSLF